MIYVQGVEPAFSAPIPPLLAHISTKTLAASSPPSIPFEKGNEVMKDLSNGLASHQRLALPVRSESDSAVADQARPYPFSSMPQSRSAPSSVAAPGPAHHEVKLESPAPIPSDDDKEGQALAELAHLVRLQTDLDQTHLQAQVRLHRETVSFALASRLLRCGQTLHRTMIDNLRSDDKKTFGSLYNAFQDVRNSCQATRRHASLDPAMNSEPSMKPLSGTGDFMHTLPPRVSDQLLHFLEKVRSSPNYLADRIASLSTSELSALTTSYRTSSPVASVMPQPNRGKGPNPWNLHHSGQDQVPAAKLLSFERHDPLSSLLYTIYPRGGRRDDAEELRRTDVWATTCARLFVEGIPGGDEVILTVLDAWADLREWPGKARLELLLSQALQDGAFLLDGSEGHAAHVKAQTLLAGTGSSTAVAERFFSKMVVDLLELMKTQQAGIGLPEGLLEIGQAILQKLDGQREEQAARTLIICNWLFSRFLPEVLVKPETLGLMTGQHISEQARRKILGEIAARIQKHVWDVTLEWRNAKSVAPDIRHLIQDIFSLFEGKASEQPRSVLYPRTNTQSSQLLQETQSFLVVSPSDIRTLVHTLFPEQHSPIDTSSRDPQCRSRWFGGWSVQEPSSSTFPRRPFSQLTADSFSTFSTSVSSLSTDTNSRILSRNMDGNSSFTSLASAQTIDNNTSTQASGRQIRATVADMFRHLDQEDTDRSPHPCADRWAVLYISNDGQRLALEPHNDDSCPSERLEAGEGDPLDREEYQHDLEQLERVIRKLLLEYETPHPFVPNSDVDQLSDVSDCVPLERVPDAVVAEQISKPTSSTPPWEFEVRTSTDDAGTFQPGSDSSQSRLSSTTPEAVCQRRQESPSALDVMLQAALENRYTALDFPGANYYWSALDRLHRLSLGQHRVSRWLLGRMSSSYRRSLCKLSQSLKKIEAKVAGLRDSHQRIDLAVSGLSNRIRDLRDTMWFVTDVRHSAEYEEVSNLTAALKKMGHSSVSSHGRFVASRPRSLTKPIVNQFLNKSDAQTIDVLTAAPDQGGYKKLSDDQSERTRKWLEGRGIEIFCKGEERIHRFCMEIDKCVNKLVGPGILESPVLWSSDLFMKERELLDSGTSRAERFLAGVDVQGPDDIQHWGDVNRATSEPSGQHKREKTVLVGDPRVGTPTGPSPPAIARSWYNVPGHMDRSARDFRGRSGPSTPLSSIDTSKLFWSPFMDDSQSPKKEGRPHADSILDLSRGVQKGTRVNVSVEKHHFLLALKRRLTSLLLSDLGGSLWSNGSETDGWFFGELGDECVRRKRCTDQTVEQGALGVQGGRQLSDQGWTSSGDEGGARGAGTVPRTIPSSKPASASSIDQVVKGNLSLGGKRIQPGHRPYPFAAAYRVSMHKFTVLPDPLAKLDALYELHLLISASLSGPVSTGAPSPSQASALRCAPTHSTNTQEGLNPAASHSIYSEGEAKALASASHAAALIDRSPASTTGSKPRQGPSDVRSDSGATDQVVKVLRDLFHADIMRPRTLFRDLQFIAAFVPTAILNDTPRGKAFWDAGLAASGLKQEVCQTMVEIADGIVASHTHARSLSPTRTRVGSGEVSERASGRLGMREAGRMWSITAKEGDAVAQRELAIFYLTHPELVERTTLPLSRPKDVFKAYVMDEGRHEDPMRSDPATMCVAYHWMELSSKGGDDLANQYLKSREELNALP